MSRFPIFLSMPDVSKYKPLILFVLKTLAILLGLLFFKTIHRLLLDAPYDFWISSFLRNLNIYAVVADTIIFPVKWLLAIIGYDSVIYERIISIPGYRGVEIQGPCMGFDVISIFVAFLVAYPGKATVFQKVTFIVGGILLIHLLNISRVTALLINNIYNVPLPMNHHDLYNIIIYSFIIGFFYLWIKYFSKPSINVKEEKK